MCETKTEDTLANEFKKEQLALRISMRSKTKELSTLTADAFELIRLYIKDVVFDETEN